MNPTTSNKKKKATKHSEVISPPGCTKHPGLRDAPAGQQKGMSRRCSRGERQKWLPKRGRQQGLQQGLRELQRGRAPGDHTLCCINSQISSLWKWHRQPKLSLEWCLCLEQVCRKIVNRIQISSIVPHQLGGDQERNKTPLTPADHLLFCNKCLNQFKLHGICKI